MVKLEEESREHPTKSARLIPSGSGLSAQIAQFTASQTKVVEIFHFEPSSGPMDHPKEGATTMPQCDGVRLMLRNITLH